MPPKKCYALVENLPKYSTKKDIFETFSKYGKILLLHIFRFKYKEDLFDFQTSLIQFEDNSASFERVTKDIINVGQRQLKVTTRDNIQDIQSVYLMFGDQSLNLDQRFQDLLSTLGIYNFHQLIFPGVKSQGSYIFCTNNQFNITHVTKTLNQYQLQTLLPVKKKCFEVPREELLNIFSMKELYDFYLIYFGRRYGIIRSIGSFLSRKISESRNNFINLPNIEGPIELIIEYLHLQCVEVSEENEYFFGIICKYLEIDEISNNFNFSLERNITVYNCVEYLNIFPMKEEKEFVIKFISNHLNEIYSNETIYKVSSQDFEDIIKYSSTHNDTHDSLVYVILHLRTDENTRNKYLSEYVDINKISYQIVEEILERSSTNINHIRDFIVKLIQ